MTLDADALSHLKVKDLQRELKKRGLDTGGLKAALLQRLKEHLQQEVESAKGEEQEKEEQQEKEEDKAGGSDSKKEENGDAEDGSEQQQEDEKVGAGEEQGAEHNGGDFDAEDKPETTAGMKRGAEEVRDDEDEDAQDAKRPKLEKGTETSSPQPEDEDTGKTKSSADATNGEKAVNGETGATPAEPRKTLRIDNFVRPFTLNAVKAFVQEFGTFVEDGFWMDTIKTHCYVTYPSVEIAEMTSAALDGKLWPPENGRSLSVKLVDHTAMEVSRYGEANLPSRPKTKDSNGTKATQRQKVTIDEFFQKTETKPVLYYLPLTDEQVKERKQRQSQQPESQPRKRRHRGGRKRNRRSRFQRR